MNDLLLEYVKAAPADKAQMVELVGRNSAVGGNYYLKFEDTGKCLILNSFDKVVAEATDNLRHFQIALNRNFKLGASLAWVAFDSGKNRYFASFLIFAYNPKTPEFEIYIDRFKKRLAEGVRPNAEISEFEISQIKNSGGKWKESKIKLSVNLPEGCALTKSKQEIMDRIIEAARNKHPGCWVGTIVFFAVIGVLIVIVLKSCGL